VLFRTSVIEGRRIVDIQFVFDTIAKIKHEGFNCTFFDLSNLSILYFIGGLFAIFTYQTGADLKHIYGGGGGSILNTISLK